MASKDNDFNRQNTSAPGSSSPKPNAERDQNIKKLNDQLNRRDDDDDDRKGAFWLWFKRIGIILLVLILLGGIGVAVYFFTRNKADITGGAQIKLSTQLTENLDPEQGSSTDQSIRYKQIYPGDKFAVVVAVRNSDNFSGDENEEGANIYVRYKISLMLDGVEYTDVIVPVISDIDAENWHIYNPTEEIESYKWDGYYYHYGSLKPQQSLTLFNEIQFDYVKTTNNFGGKKAEIIVNIEAVQADVANLGVDESNAWNTAPRRWINNMKKGINNQGNRINN